MISLSKINMIIKGFIGGVVGVALSLFVWHLWLDHVALHQVINIMNALAQKHSELFK
jgi:hypothetical protein